ncbi:MAG: recombination protein RecR, partial [Thermomicrobiales bacterium]|nr:recombination protein RecR [Thermomicrobiales bacterium]
MTARPVANLVEELSKLPGIGPKTATRLAYHILRDSRQNAAQLAEAILDVKDRIVLCSVCFNFSEQNPCPVCSDPTREAAICVVEEPLDVQALDRTGQFRGRYHVL